MPVQGPHELSQRTPKLAIAAAINLLPRNTYEGEDRYGTSEDELGTVDNLVPSLLIGALRVVPTQLVVQAKLRGVHSDFLRDEKFFLSCTTLLAPRVRVGDASGEAPVALGLVEADEEAGAEGVASGREVTRPQSTSTVSTRCSMASRSASSWILALSATTQSRPSGAAANVWTVAPSTPHSYQVCSLPDKGGRS